METLLGPAVSPPSTDSMNVSGVKLCRSAKECPQWLPSGTLPSTQFTMPMLAGLPSGQGSGPWKARGTQGAPSSSLPGGKAGVQSVFNLLGMKEGRSGFQVNLEEAALPSSSSDSHDTFLAGNELIFCCAHHY